MSIPKKAKKSLREVDLILESANELVTLASLENRARMGSEMKDAGILEDGAIAVHRGKVVECGSSLEILSKYRSRKRINAKGKTVLPGFVDPHTHPVFLATRENEFEARIEGKSYQEIAAAGGGILSSVRSVREASKSTLVQQIRKRLDRFLALGTTTVEAKSGYGLSTESELKSLEALREAAKGHAVEVVPSFLGAHEIAPEFRSNPSRYVEILVKEMLPLVKKKKLAEFCDIFCEKGVFELEDSRKILEAAKRLGFKLRVHADELAALGGAELAADLKAFSADHLVQISELGIRRMAEAKVIAVLLPGTSFYLRLSQDAPARKLIQGGVAVALGTDFNPGSCYTQSMPMILTLAAVRLRMTPTEAITAATLNAAFSIGRGDRIGSLHSGKQADFIVCDVPNHRHLAYEFGRSPVETVIKKGKIVFQRQARI